MGVALVGDALIEPFWPQGLGIIRGFFGALDVCHAVMQWASGVDSLAATASFTEAYTKLKSLNAATRVSTLHKDEKSYALAPSTRYRDNCSHNSPRHRGSWQSTLGIFNSSPSPTASPLCQRAKKSFISQQQLPDLRA